MDKTREVLRNAKRLLMKRGAWIKGSYERGGSYCALGAVRKAAQDAGVGYGEAERVLYDGVKKLYGNRFTDVPSFNDYGATTLDDVLKAFNKAIMEAKQ